jgi:hypothetical protein
MNLMLQKTIGREARLRLKVFLGYQRTLNPKKSKHLKEGRIKGIKGIYESGRGRCAT